MVYYRKYRPQLISELDLASVREKLTSILSSQNIPHAFLFTGSKGLGKTSSARILAKAINCERRKKGTVEPCNTCSACISITNGSATDVLEIDAASNRGIDEIRDLRERIKFSPSSLSKKVYIIDEVHMLTTEAFNALLKTLEEPPEHVMFILATTETGKLPETILSRVFQVTFEKPTPSELARSFERIAKGEDLDIEEGVLEKIGDLSDGAFRDGAKILEELSLQSNQKKITLELLENLYKSGSTDLSTDELITAVFKKDVKKAIKIIDTLSQNNADFKQVIEKTANKLHALLVEQALKSQPELKDTKLFLNLLDEAYKQARGAVLPQLPLEIAVIEYCIKNEPQSVTSTLQKPFAVNQGGSPEMKANDQRPAASDKPTSPDLFKKLVDSVNMENKILAGLLRGCKLVEEQDKIILHTPSSFHLGKLQEFQNKTIIEAHLHKVLQKEVALEIKN